MVLGEVVFATSQAGRLAQCLRGRGGNKQWLVHVGLDGLLQLVLVPGGHLEVVAAGEFVVHLEESPAEVETHFIIVI